MEQMTPVQTVYWVLYGLWILSEVFIVLKTRTSRSKGNVQDRGSMALLWVVIFSSIGVANWFAATRPHNMFQSSGLDGGQWLLPLSALVLAIGLAIRWTAIVTLGKAFSVNVAIHHDQKVLRTGIFRFVRHPSYTGLMIVFLAIGLHLRNWTALAFVILPPLAALLYRIHVEEAALNGAFGADYADYSRSTKRLIPFVY
ncbi:MAG: isoprenylcysteine carboxylmethyltransferase family protein [Acidobacteriota bacterium]